MQLGGFGHENCLGLESYGSGANASSLTPPDGRLKRVCCLRSMPSAAAYTDMGGNSVVALFRFQEAALDRP